MKFGSADLPELVSSLTEWTELFGRRNALFSLILSSDSLGRQETLESIVSQKVP